VKPSVKPVPAFTSLRGLAAIWVVAYHFRESLAGSLPRLAFSLLGEGFLAVDLFFILSGFVITLNYRWMLEDLTLGTAKLFIVARLARIYPVHLFMCLLFLINPVCILLFSTARDLGARYDPGYYLLSLLLMQNWGLASQLEWNNPAWSISTEWFVYLMFPALLLGLKRLPNTVPTIAGAIIVVLAALALLFDRAGLASIGDAIPQFGLARCLCEFLVGMGLCRLTRLVAAPGTLLTLGLLGLAGALVVATIGFALPDFILLPGACALVITALASERSPLGGWLARKPLLWLGEISYALYMTHYFVKDWIKFAGLALPGPAIFLLYLSLVLLAGLAVYYGIEKPGRQYFRSIALKNV
jgi:peptidoglycan/LPS O-acetylase OafA/YrhL